MIEHDEARMLVSARSDGELDLSRAVTMDEHLASCADCSSFAARLPQLSAIVAMLPREHAPVDLASRVATRLPRSRAAAAPVARRAWSKPGLARRWRLTPALAGALAVALILVIAGEARLVRVPRAEAAEALARLKTFSIVREIRELDRDGSATSTTAERVWFRAPDQVRIERTTTFAGGGVSDELVIERAGERYTRRGDTVQLQKGLPPTPGLLPEPLSPSIALYGTELGSGPSVAGRPTVRYEFVVNGERKIATVDAQTFSVLGGEDSAILSKDTRDFGYLVRTKRTLEVHYNQPIADEIFRIPLAAVTDAGFHPRSVREFPAPPAGGLEGFSIVSSVSSGFGYAVLYAHGAFPVLIRIDGDTGLSGPTKSLTTRIGTQLAGLLVGLYELPTIRFTIGTHTVAVSAPLQETELAELAARLYPEAARP